MSVSACITSVSGPVLLAEERAFLREAAPWGVILMGRSCVDKAQVQTLTREIHEALGREALIFIDQEGGRVARLKAPEWPKFPAAGVYGELYSSAPEAAEEACYLGHRLMGQELAELGIHADCAPCCDLRQLDTHDAIGDRSFGFTVDAVVSLTEAALKGLSDAGVAGVVKHMPGQGRATMDTHYDLPSVGADTETLMQDMSVFSAISDQVPMGMTCHVIFEAFDPHLPTTISETVISETIRKRIGFDGLLMTDDLGMDALGGALADRGAKALAAGCDILLHCSGFLKEPADILNEMEAVASAAGTLDGQALQRARAAEQAVQTPTEFDTEQGWARFNHLMSGAEARV
ncbi:MAG: beta-N-acetylhexosaminidase [Henriciella sp.]|nr:beta-N-acetylhexosaminidase [Henriciella sp.]MBO6696590.1 beta-N-acetylhexosaminidase [Henriciella sp.]